MIYQNKNFNLRRISQSEIRNSAAAESEGGPRRRNFVSLRGKQKFFLFACPVASRGLCYGARPSVQFWFCRPQGGNQSGFRSKWVLTFSNKHHQSQLLLFWERIASRLRRSAGRKARRAKIPSPQPFLFALRL